MASFVNFCATFKSYRRYLLIIISKTVLFNFLFNPVYCLDSKCVKTGPCTCTFSNGSEINLLPIAADYQNKPVWKNQLGADSRKYSYNPCYVFTEDANCKDTHVCQIYQDSVYDNIGAQDTEQFITVDGSLALVYYSPNKMKNTTVKLQCSQEQHLEVLGESKTPDIFNMTLHSPCCCLSGCPPTGLSMGWILVITFFAVLGTYFIIGVSFMYCIKHHRGLEALPHHGFWTDLPVLVKDGAVFVANGCKVDYMVI